MCGNCSKVPCPSRFLLCPGIPVSLAFPSATLLAPGWGGGGRARCLAQSDESLHNDHGKKTAVKISTSPKPGKFSAFLGVHFGGGGERIKRLVPSSERLRKILCIGGKPGGERGTPSPT